jgi:hypothetical protein
LKLWSLILGAPGAYGGAPAGGGVEHDGGDLPPAAHARVTTWLDERDGPPSAGGQFTDHVSACTHDRTGVCA